LEQFRRTGSQSRQHDHRRGGRRSGHRAGARSYWIVCPKAVSALPKIKTFRDWLLAEANDDLRSLKAIAQVRPR
jgi:hypothetical protein